MHSVFKPVARQGVFVCDASQLEWQSAGKPGISLKPVRYDSEQGQFLGMVGFEPMVRSGTHQHQGVATSYFVDGALTDHQGTAVAGEVGVNLKGATHDAIAYRKSLLVSRLEAPVLYLPDEEQLSLVHAGARQAAFESYDVQALTDLNICVNDQPQLQTGVPGVRRRMIFEYAGCEDDRRLLELQFQAGAAPLYWQCSARVELWVHGGGLLLNGQTLWANCFAIIEPETRVQIESRFGARILLWADGRVVSGNDATLVRSADVSSDLFGFQFTGQHS